MESEELQLSQSRHGYAAAEDGVGADEAHSAQAAEMARLAGDYSHSPYRRRIVLPVVLLLATCGSTFWAGTVYWEPIKHMGSFAQMGREILANWQPGLIYMTAVMAILLTHEMGHFLMALRHRIPASLPFFLPVPFFPFGTMGAVIAMQGSRANRRQMFDLGLAGPLAGLAIAVPIAWIGIQQLDPSPHSGGGFPLHHPLIFTLLIDLLRPDLPSDTVLGMNQFNPLLMAGWVGMLVTGLNMLPISQLDGGHVAYALLGRRRAHLLARGLVIAAITAILIWELYAFVVMLVLVILLGIHHPPTADDHVKLGWPRHAIGWASLAIPILCFPPMRLS